MFNPPQATQGQVYDAGLVQNAALGQDLLTRLTQQEPITDVVQSILNLGFGLETVALSPRVDEQDDVQAYLMETYGLFAVGTDPLLRPLLPAIPTQGATIRPRVLAINNRALVVNGKLLILGGRLVAAEPSL